METAADPDSGMPVMAGRQLRTIIDEHGPDAVALYVSGQISIEAQYLATKLAKGFMQTVHIESNSRLCMASAGTGYKQSLGADGPPGSYTDFDCADLLLQIKPGTDVALRRRRGQPGGVCSTFLADRAAAAPVFLQRSPHFRPPDDGGTPMIMVGPGTGIAPFRGFLQERRALGHAGRNWLFFGDQHRGENFYYRDDLEDMARDGLLNRLDLAFSRDQADRVYVQHKMLDYGADVWRWLDDGAHFYVCGDAAPMAEDVDAVLTAIIRRHGSMSEEHAHELQT